MISRSNQILRPSDIGDNVTISMPSVDRECGDPRNIVSLETHFSADTEQYKPGTRHGQLNSTFSRNKCIPSTFHGLSEAEIDSNTKIIIREATRLQSIGDVYSICISVFYDT